MPTRPFDLNETDECPPLAGAAIPWDDGGAMRDFWTLARQVVSMLVAFTASYYLVVAFDNITNPQSNWVYVKGVLSLDGVAPNSGFGWRAIEAAWFHVLAYVLVIAAETTAGVLLALGAVAGLRRGRDHEKWVRAQWLTVLGCGLGLAIFLFGFVVVGGNWFVMYLNPKWNGLMPAFQNSVLTLLTLIAVVQVAMGGRPSVGDGRAAREAQPS